jgi:dTDP-4-dehydrorhamnose 3,5-epimerase
MKVDLKEFEDVIVDIRRWSPTFGKWAGIRLSEFNKKQLYIPKDYAHGYCVLSDTALFTCKCSEFYTPECEKGVLWSDPDIGIDWPIRDPIISKKDSSYPVLKHIPDTSLPKMSFDEDSRK